MTHTQYHLPDEIIFVGTDWELTLDTETNVSAMVTTQIHFRKPNKKAWYKRTATIVGTNYLRIDIPYTDNNVHGDWTFRTYCVDATGKRYKGTFFVKNIHKDWIE